MIKGEKVTFKCPLCEFSAVLTPEELAVEAYYHYREVHDENN